MNLMNKTPEGYFELAQMFEDKALNSSDPQAAASYENLARAYRDLGLLASGVARRENVSKKVPENVGST
jgi:hypothetical protein